MMKPSASNLDRGKNLRARLATFALEVVGKTDAKSRVRWRSFAGRIGFCAPSSAETLKEIVP